MIGKSIIIIGGGISGLSAGIYSQANGYSTMILEQHSQPGGLAAWWKRKDYLIDNGVHFLIGHRPGSRTYEMYQEVGIPNDQEFPDMDVYMRFTDQRSGKNLDFTTDMDKLASDMKQLFPKDIELINSFILSIKKMQRSENITDLGIGSPSELQSFFDKLRMVWSMRKEIKFFTGNYAKPISELASKANDPLLKDILLNLFTEDSPLAFVLMILAIVANRNLGLLKEGCQDLIGNMVRRYESLGGKIQYKKRVKEIIVKDGMAVGVRLDDDTEIQSNLVISAADGWSTIFGMLGGKYVDSDIEERYDTWDVIPPYLLISYGVAMEFKNIPSSVTIFLKEPVIIEGKERRVLSLRILNYGERFAPPGKCVLQAFYLGDFEFWNQLHKDKMKYNAEKERISRETTRRLEESFPGFASKIEVLDVSTPYTTYRYTSNWKGSPMGWAISMERMSKSLPRTLPGLENLFMIGQWAQPGGGVPSCVAQGRQIVQILCNEDGIEFHPPSRIN